MRKNGVSDTPVAEGNLACGGCGAANESTSRFCGSCGNLLRPICHCGFRNDPHARFCGGCGAELKALFAAPQAERRQVAVLFADLAGYTNLSARHDPEQVHLLLEQLFQTVDDITVAFGGSVNQHPGDAVLALFGAPVAHGDDAERAVAAALAMHEAVRQLRAPDGSPLALHIGIASGVVVAASTGSREHRIYTVTGPSVNLASRLMEIGTAGETLICEAVFKALRKERLRAVARGQVALKGVPDPVSVWSVEAFDSTLPAGTSGTFVGRDVERAQFARIVAVARERRTGGVIYVRGDPGMGKSRLAYELAQQADEAGFTWAAAKVLDFGISRGHDAMPQLVRGFLGLTATSEEERRRDAAQEAIASGHVPDEHTALLSQLLDIPLSMEQRRAIDAMEDATRRARRVAVMTALVEATTAAAPVLVVVDDIHWADRETLDAVAALARLTMTRPVVLILTSRIDGDPMQSDGGASLHSIGIMALELGPLMAAESLQLVTNLGLIGPLADECVERAAGNPLFLEQLVHYADDLQKKAVPPSIQSLVLARLDQLGSDDRVALQAASVLGQCFSLAALRYVLENGDYRCEPLLRRHLIRHDGEQLMFDHALIRDGVYASLLRSRCQELHKRAAAWFADTDAVLHAEHLDRAGDASAAHALDAAARAEFMSYRAESALDLARRALSRATGAAERCEIACLEGEILSELGYFDEARVAYETACSEAAGDEAARCRARIGLAGALRLADRLDEAHAQLDAAEEAAEGLGLVAELSRLHFLRGNLHFPLGRIDLCRREHDAALQAAQAAGRPELVVSALGGVADAAFAQGRFHTALDCYSRCVALAREQGLGRVEVANFAMVQTCHQLMGIPGGREEAEAALLAASRVGHRRAEILALHGLVFGHFWALQGDFGRAHGRRAVELCERYGLTRFHAESLAFLAFAEHLAGNEKEAVRLFETATADAREHSTKYFLLSIIGYYVYVVNDPRRRAELLDEGDRISCGACLTSDRMQYLFGAIEAALRGAEWDRADLYADQLEQAFAAEPLPRVNTCVERARLLAALGRGVCTSDMRSALERIQADIGRMDMNLYAASVERALSELPV